jgi:hypothetical protein
VVAPLSVEMSLAGLGARLCSLLLVLPTECACSAGSGCGAQLNHMLPVVKIIQPDVETELKAVVG